jgi:hypothetical protein
MSSGVPSQLLRRPAKKPNIKNIRPHQNHAYSTSVLAQKMADTESQADCNEANDEITPWKDTMPHIGQKATRIGLLNRLANMMD